MNQQEAWNEMKAMTRDLSPILYNYYAELVRLGFTEEQAFEITKDFQLSLLNVSKRRG